MRVELRRRGQERGSCNCRYNARAEVPFFILRFKGLDPEKHYLCDFDGRVYSGSNLMNAGLNLTRPTERTYSSLKIYLKAQ